MSSDLQQTVARLFSRWRDGDDEAGTLDALWAESVDMGLPWIGLPDDLGGVGGDLSDIVDVLVEVGRHGVPLPFAETAVLGGWLHVQAGQELSGKTYTVAGRAHDLRLEDTRLFGTAPRVAFADRADVVAVLVEAEDGLQIVGIDPKAAAAAVGRSLADEPRSDLTFEGAEVLYRVTAPAGVDAAALQQRGALTRVAMMAGALGSATAMTLEYAKVREQFGRPLTRFQAIQAHLVTIVQETELVATALALAVNAAEAGDGAFEIASAKVLAGTAAGTVPRAAHQVHGAMGFTQEYDLHHFTRRLWAWRSEYGTSEQWGQVVGELALARGAEGVYPLIAQ